MKIKILIIAGAMLHTFFLQAASGDHTPTFFTRTDNHSNLLDIIGFSCGSKGNASLISSTISSDSRECLITLVYSEHPTLKESEKLNLITQNIAQNNHNYDSELLKSACVAEISKHINQIREDDCISERPPINLIALCIKLCAERIQHAGYHQNAAGNDNRWGESHHLDIIEHKQTVLANHHILCTSAQPVASARETAPCMQHRNPDKPFHLVLDLEKWRKIINPEHITKTASTYQPAHGHTTNAQNECLQQ